MEKIIKITALTKIYNQGKYNQVKALNGIDMEIEKGKTIAIMGVSGSGKSTLLNILGCLDKPTKGEYLVAGEDVAAMSSNKLANLRGDKFGFILQENALLGKDTVQENVKLPLIFSNKYKWLGQKKRVNEVLNSLDISDLMKRKVSQLSGGQRQRVAIARAIINDPDVIFADEPTSALDSNTANEIMKVLVNLVSKGKTLIIVTHDILIANFADIIYTIKDGKIINKA